MNQNKKYKIGVTAGQFDFIHAGHMLMFKECKKYCTYLIIFLQKDASLTDIKYRGKQKHKPIMSLKERKIMLSGIKYIDKIIVYESEQDLKNLLKTFSIKYNNQLVRIIGVDWKNKEFTGKNLNIPTIFNSRNHNYSTTSLISKIKKVYEG